jgi:hypothetical protein
VPGSQPVVAPEVDQTKVTGDPTETRVQLRCESTPSPCRPPIDMDLMVNEVRSCYFEDGAFTVDLRNRAAAEDEQIRISIPSFTGTGTYQVAAPGWVKLRDNPSRARSCSDSTPTTGAVEPQFPAGGSRCDRPCTVKVTDSDASAPGARMFAIEVSCDALCFANSNYQCTAAGGGRVEFQTSRLCGPR